MSKPVKFLSVLLASALVLVIVLIILIKLVVTPEKVRSTLLPLVENRLQRKVELGAVDIGLLSGISLNDLVVKKKDGSEPFVAIKSLQLNYQLLPLLSGKVVIDTVQLRQPEIQIVRLADGQFNFSDLLVTAAPKEAAPAAEKGSGETAGSLDLLVKEVDISGGQLVFVDRFFSHQTPYHYSLEQIKLKAEQISLDRSFPFHFSAVLNDAAIDLAGDYDLAGRRGELRIKLAPLKMIPFSPYYRELLPGKLASATVALDMDVHVDPQQFDSKGLLRISDLGLQLDALPQAKFDAATLGVDYAVNYQLANQHLALSTLTVDFNGVKLAAQGDIELQPQPPRLALSVLFDKLDLRTLFKAVPEGLTRALQPYSLAGQMSGRVELAGRPADGAQLLQSAHLRLNDVQASVAELRSAINGDLDYRNDSLRGEQLRLDVDGQQAFLNLALSGLLKPQIKGTFALTAERLDLNALLARTSAAQAAGSGPGPQSQSASGTPTNTAVAEIGPFNIPAEVAGTLAVDTLLYKKLTMTDVTAALQLKNNHLLINDLRSKVAGGELVAKTDVNLGVKGLAYQGQVGMTQSSLLTLVSGLLPENKQQVSGQLNWQNSFSGHGTDPQKLLKALQLDGAVTLQKGEISGSPLLNGLAAFLGSPDLKVLSFEDFESKYNLQQGLAKITGDLNSSKSKLKPQGTIGIDGSLDLSLDTRIAPELLQKLSERGVLKQVLTDQNGWGMLPLKITGTVTAPKFGLDSKLLQQQAVGKLKQDATQKLLEKLAPKDSADKEPLRQLLDGTLNKLFGQ